MYRIAVTNRHLCQEDFLTRIRRLAEDPYYDAILLREKDMTEEAYYLLARKVLQICQESRKKCILHTFHRVAQELGHPYLHLPLPLFRTLTEERKRSVLLSTECSFCPDFFTEIGTSVHSVAQAEEALRLGAAYVTAGHIFSTDCKPGLPPRGLAFIKEICESVPIPVYGIGGICQDNERSVIRQGTRGVYLMSSAMASSMAP